MNSSQEIDRLVKEWGISNNQAALLTSGFENKNLDYQKFYDIMNCDDDKFINRVIDIDVAKDIVKNYGLNNVLHLSGFEEYMNDYLSEKSELERSYTEHPYLNPRTNKIEKIEYPNL